MRWGEGGGGGAGRGRNAHFPLPGMPPPPHQLPLRGKALWEGRGILYLYLLNQATLNSGRTLCYTCCSFWYLWPQWFLKLSIERVCLWVPAATAQGLTHVHHLRVPVQCKKPFCSQMRPTGSALGDGNHLATVLYEISGTRKMVIGSCRVPCFSFVWVSPLYQERVASGSPSG